MRIVVGQESRGKVDVLGRASQRTPAISSNLRSTLGNLVSNAPNLGTNQWVARELERERVTTGLASLFFLIVPITPSIPSNASLTAA
ncbi:hypothetical protein [Mesorhizobium sp. B2-7-2]|uniref:hypothetical protein n=1 Tax=Mesorhizobium sp. B2-7-2 TaxID=2589908 RepID=UPI001FEE22B4|nr:hypothetical protein [Mesorhizobium sp. B2-7-2]